MPVLLFSGLKALLAPAAKVGLNMLLPLLTDKLLKQATYRLLKSQADQYKARAAESRETEDDKRAEMFSGMVRDVKSAWGIEE